MDSTFLSWPFFDDAHRALARDLDAWCEREIVPLEGREDSDLDGTCREIVRRLGEGGWLRLAAGERPDHRSPGQRGRKLLPLWQSQACSFEVSRLVSSIVDSIQAVVAARAGRMHMLRLSWLSMSGNTI